VQPAADLAVLNANVITVDDANPRAEAVAILGGRFVAAGTTADVKPWIGSGTAVIDAAGRTLVPGFNDAHVHTGPLHPETPDKAALGPEHVRTIDELIAALRAKAETTPNGQWICGGDYQDTKLGRHVTRWDLDKASAEHPILVEHSSLHMWVVNSRALKTANVTKDTPDPPGGGFGRADDGEPNGLCCEPPARYAITGAGPPFTEPIPAQRLDALRRCFERFLSNGITSIGDADVTPARIRLYRDAADERPPVRVNMMVRDYCLPRLAELGLRPGFGDPRLRLGPIKVFHGNSLSGRTCWLYEPYASPAEYCGIPPARSQEALDELIFDIHRAGLQAAVHANGDREIDMVLDAVERALERAPRPDHRHRIEHCSVVNRRILGRIKRLGIVLVLHSYIYEHGDKMEAYGEARWNMMHPNASALELGIPVAGHSDYPASAADPLLRIQSLVTRTTAEGRTYGPDQRISAGQAIRVFTLGGAYASFEENIKGTISAGKLADCVILSGDPTQVPPGAIKDVHVETTILDGKVVYSRSGEAGP